MDNTSSVKINISPVIKKNNCKIVYVVFRENNRNAEFELTYKDEAAIKVSNGGDRIIIKSSTAVKGSTADKGSMTDGNNASYLNSAASDSPASAPEKCEMDISIKTNHGFTNDEISQMSEYLINEKANILNAAKQINPLKSFMG